VVKNPPQRLREGDPRALRRTSAMVRLWWRPKGHVFGYHICTCNELGASSILQSVKKQPNAVQEAGVFVGILSARLAGCDRRVHTLVFNKRDPPRWEKGKTMASKMSNFLEKTGELAELASQP
jgi:hypothetical protein